MSTAGRRDVTNFRAYFKQNEETVAMHNFVNGRSVPYPMSSQDRTSGANLSLVENFWNKPHRNRRRKTGAPPPSEKHVKRRLNVSVDE